MQTCRRVPLRQDADVAYAVRDGATAARCVGRGAYIDTENTFRPERVVEITAWYEVDPDDLSDNTIVARAITSEMQSELLEQVAAQMSITRRTVS